MEEGNEVFENEKDVQLNISSKCFDDSDDGSEHYKKYFLDADQFFDEISDRVTVSRMVNDSLIKGILKAVSEETHDTILAKDVEIANLHNELKRCESELLHTKCFLSGMSIKNASLEAVMIDGIGASNELEILFTTRNVDQYVNDAFMHCGEIQVEAQMHKVMKEIGDVRILVSNALADNLLLNSGSMDNELSSTSSSVWTSVSEVNNDGDVSLVSELKNISRKVAKMEKEFHTLKDVLMYSCSLFSKSTMVESRWMSKIQEAVCGIVLQGFVESSQQVYVEALREEQASHPQHVWCNQQTILSNLREELENISQYLFDFNLEHPFLHGSHGHHDQMADGPKRVQQKVLGGRPLTGNQEQDSAIVNSSSNTIEIPDFTHLKHLNKDELINYFRNEMIKMSRNHESQLHAVTEDCFRLKRELLKDKPFVSIRKDKGFDGLNQRIMEVVSEIDHIIKQNSTRSLIFDDNRKICGMMNQMTNENQNMKNMLTDKKKESMVLTTQLTDAYQKVSLQHSKELNLLNQRRKFESDMEESELQSLLRDEIHKVVLKEFLLGHHCEIIDSDLESVAMHEFCECLLEETLKDAEGIIKYTMEKYYEEKQLRYHFESLAEEQRQSVCTEIAEKEHLKAKIVSLSSVLEEKEQLELAATSNLVRQKEDLEVAFQEINKLRHQTAQQDRQIIHIMRDLDTACGSRDSALQQVAKLTDDLKALQQRLNVALNDLSEANTHRVNLVKCLQEKECLVSMLLQKEKEQKGQWEVVSSSINDCWKEILEFEERVSAMISLNNLRFQTLNGALRPLIQHGGIISRRGLWYRKMLSDLQTAEYEVDLLGDEVDGLLTLLEKIYFALDHYSPILKYYPGIMEILQMIRQELSEEKSTGRSPLVYQHTTP